MTNIIYLTTRCNLDCDYCYERSNRLAPGFTHKVVTLEEIDNFVTDVCRRDQGPSSCVVIFGGEPLLRPDLIGELVDRFIAREKTVWFDLVTNGTLLTRELAETLKGYRETLQKVGSGFDIEVSYDVSGQSRRGYPNGSSSQADVLAGIGALRESGLPFSISYVVTTTNAVSLARDVLYCILALGAQKVCLRWATQELIQGGLSAQDIKEKVRPLLQEIHRRYGIPICEEVCGACKKCHKGNEGNTYMIPSKGVLTQPTFVDTGFTHFLF